MDAQSAALESAKTGDTTAAYAHQTAAKGFATARASGPSIAHLNKLGVTPGSNISQEKAEEVIKSNWSDADKTKYATAVRMGDKKTQDEMLTTPAATLKTNVANLKINKNSSAWHQAYQNKIQQTQIYAGVGTALAQTINGVGNMENELYQAAGTKDSAASQVESATVQAMSTGLSQTEQIAEQLRQNQTAVAQDQSSMVSATRV